VGNIPHFPLNSRQGKCRKEDKGDKEKQRKIESNEKDKKTEKLDKRRVHK
jgi:hypothetical protein